MAGKHAGTVDRMRRSAGQRFNNVKEPPIKHNPVIITTKVER
jgi:hypothetical protein